MLFTNLGQENPLRGMGQEALLKCRENPTKKQALSRLYRKAVNAYGVMAQKYVWFF